MFGQAGVALRTLSSSPWSASARIGKRKTSSSPVVYSTMITTLLVCSGMVWPPLVEDCTRATHVLPFPPTPLYPLAASLASCIDKDSKALRNQRIFDRWLACWTEEDIAKEENIGEQTVRDILSTETADLPKPLKVLADFADDAFYKVIIPPRQVSRGQSHHSSLWTI